MRVCPTEALRVTAGKAIIHPDWCIDCGECYRVCPTRAMTVLGDDLHLMANYKKSVLLVPIVFFSQFEGVVPRDLVIGYLGGLGFDEIATVEQSVDTLIDEINDYLVGAEKPIISSFCPVVIRLIQVRFPFLVDRIMPLLPPMEITAQYYRSKHAEEGGADSDLGIFYVTPCIGKTASIREPVGGYTSPITGTVNMDVLYNKIMLSYKQKVVISSEPAVNDVVSSRGVLYPTTGGESAHINGRTLAVDGMKNVIDFLELLESEKIKGVDYLELRACDESCAGGILSFLNRFLVSEVLHREANRYPIRHDLIEDYKKHCKATISMEPIAPRSMVKYGRNIKKALEKMNQARRLKNLFPDIDCGACGAPSCAALAEDIVRGQSEISACIFLRTLYEKRGDITQEEATLVMEQIWGKDRFDV